MTYGALNAETVSTQSGFVLGAGDASGFKNRLINGDMVLDQRYSGTQNTNSSFTVDRFFTYNTQSGKFNVQQNAGSVTPPAGFAKYLGITASANYALLSSDFFGLCQVVEAYNWNDMAWGTASARPVTLSFWVYSSVTGTFGVTFQNGSQNRFYLATYTINVANTWEYKTITISGDTSGTWTGTNGAGLYLSWGLGQGSNTQGSPGSWGTTFYNGPTGGPNVIGTSGNTFYITGAQLEVGSFATSFEYRPYGTELALCQRYYYKIKALTNYNVYGNGSSWTTTIVRVNVPFPVTMRAIPTVFDFSAANTFLLENSAGVNAVPSAIADSTNTGQNMANLNLTVSSVTQGLAFNLYSNNNTNSYMGFGAELGG